MVQQRLNLTPQLTRKPESGNKVPTRTRR
jgi:hypothetical protein